MGNAASTSPHHPLRRSLKQRENGSRRGGILPPGSPPQMSSAAAAMPLPKMEKPQVRPLILTPEQQEILAQHCIKMPEGLRIDLAKRQFDELPAWLALLTHMDTIKDINLTENNLRSFPTILSDFPQLERLALGSNAILSIPDEIGNLQSLVWLDFTHNRVSHISDRLGDLPELQSLGASDCRLTSFPLSFTRLAKIRKLGIFNNMIASIPPEIGNLQQLTKLDLSGNALVTLPPEIGQLRNLNWLNLSNNQLVSLPDEFSRLTGLRELGLSHNRLSRLPNLENMRDLAMLTVFNNQLEELGDWIVHLIRLAKLDLSSNNLTRLPEGILALPSLDLLNVRSNRIVELPPSNRKDPTQRPSRLTVLDLRDNAICSLPISLLCDSLQELKCAGNPLMDSRDMAQTCLVPTLRQKAFMRLTGQMLDMRRDARKIMDAASKPIKWTLVMTATEREGRRCAHCKQIYLQLPLRCLDMRQTSDGVAPFLVECCGPNCRKEYLRSSGPTVASSRSVQSPRPSH